jgi:hypothetical protein
MIASRNSLLGRFDSNAANEVLEGIESLIQAAKAKHWGYT